MRDISKIELDSIYLDSLSQFEKRLLIEKHLYDNSCISYFDDLLMYFRYLDKNNIKEFYNYKIINKYIEYLSKNNYNVNSILRKISAIKCFCHFYIKDNNIDDFTNKIEVPKYHKYLPNVLSKEEVEKLLNFELKTSYDYRNKAMLELLYATGVRVSELCNLKLENIDLDLELVRCFGKGMKERMIPIGDIANYYLKLYINEYRDLLKKTNISENEYLFFNNHGKCISRQGFYLIIKNIAKKQGITKDISPHTLRHSFASHLLNNGADLRVIQEMLGHSNISTTGIYVHINNKENMDDYHTHHPRG